jgi:hypothetical protein
MFCACQKGRQNSNIISLSFIVTEHETELLLTNEATCSNDGKKATHSRGDTTDIVKISSLIAYMCHNSSKLFSLFTFSCGWHAALTLKNHEALLRNFHFTFAVTDLNKTDTFSALQRKSTHFILHRARRSNALQ